MLSLYVAVVVAVGLTVLVTTVALDGGEVLSDASGQLWLFAILAAVGELTPIKIFRRGSEGEITLSTTFAFALLLLAGLPAALMALALASVVADIAHRKPVTKALFNVSQYALSMAAAGAVLDLISAVPRAARAALRRGRPAGDPALRRHLLRGQQRAGGHGHLALPGLRALGLLLARPRLPGLQRRHVPGAGAHHRPRRRLQPRPAAPARAAPARHLPGRAPGAPDRAPVAARRPHLAPQPGAPARPHRPGHPRRPARPGLGRGDAHRPRPLQGGQRHARPSPRRSPPAGDRAAPEPDPARLGHDRASGRRRVRDPPAQRARRLLRHGGGAQDHPRHGAALRRAGPLPPGGREHRARLLPDPRLRRGHAGSARGHRDVHRQGRADRGGDLRPRAGQAQPRPPHARLRPAQGGGTRGARRPLPAQGGAAHRAGPRGGGPRPLAAPRAGPGAARGVRAHGREHRTHRADDHARAQPRARAAGGLARRGPRPRRGGQPLGPQPPRPPAPREHLRAAAPLERPARAPAARDHREHDHGRPGPGDGGHRRPGLDGRQALHRRLRDRLLLAGQPQAAAGLRDQDRQVVHPEHERGPQRRGHRALHHRPRAQPGAGRRGRRGGERVGARRAQPPGLRSRPGLLPQPPRSRGAAHALAGRRPSPRGGRRPRPAASWCSPGGWRRPHSGASAC